jgi:hypothetical protein
VRPPETGNGPPPRARPGNHQPPPSRRTAPDYGQGSSPAVKRSAAKFWRLYHAYCDGTREMDTDHWRRWQALRRASPGVARDQLKQLLGTLDGVETETLTAVCAAVQGVAA